jgi:hypothetical protein
VARRDWVRARISNLTKPAQNLLILTWPNQIPKLQQCDHDQLDTLIKTIQTIETETSAPFHPADPTTPKPESKLSIFKEDNQ